MSDNDPREEEIEFEDTDPLPTDNTDIEESEFAATTDVPPVDLIDLIASERASDARAEIFRNLYNKVGERIEGLKSTIRGTPNAE